jgi:hypothetical protein
LLLLCLWCPPQAATLLLFNEAEELSYGEVQERLNLQVGSLTVLECFVNLHSMFGVVLSSGQLIKLSYGEVQERLSLQVRLFL